MADRGLHVAVDGRELVGRPTGVGRYSLEILKQWAAAPTPHRYTVVLPAEPTPALLGLGDRFTWRVLPDRVAGTWWEQTQLPRLIARERPDVLFAPAYTAPVRLQLPLVLVIHDLSYFAHPEWFAWREGLRRRWVTRMAARRARAVVTVSEFSRDEIHRYLGIPTARLVLAPQGAPPLDPPDSAPRAPLVLYVGSLFNRRHIPDMIRAFASVAAAVPNARFVLAGDNRTSPRLDPRAIAAELGMADRVEWREYVSDAELDRLYRSARVLLFLSDYEGFGMTPLEALAHGVPSILLDTAVSREVYGDGALRVPAEPPALADTLHRLLTDEGTHASVLTAGRARLAAFSWTRSAEIITRALERAAE